jgi:hypothetical protein
MLMASLRAMTQVTQAGLSSLFHGKNGAYYLLDTLNQISNSPKSALNHQAIQAMGEDNYLSPALEKWMQRLNNDDYMIWDGAEGIIRPHAFLKNKLDLVQLLNWPTGFNRWYAQMSSTLAIQQQVVLRAVVDYGASLPALLKPLIYGDANDERYPLPDVSLGYTYGGRVTESGKPSDEMVLNHIVHQVMGKPPFTTWHSLWVESAQKAFATVYFLEVAVASQESSD